MLPSYLPKAAPSSIDLKEDESQLVELLNYYRHKVGKYKQIYKPSPDIDNQERERVEWLAEIEQMRLAIEDIHSKEDAIL